MRTSSQGRRGREKGTHSGRTGGWLLRTTRSVLRAGSHEVEEVDARNVTAVKWFMTGSSSSASGVLRGEMRPSGRAAERERGGRGDALPVEHLDMGGAKLLQKIVSTRSRSRMALDERTVDSGSIEMRRLRSSRNHQCSSPASPRDSRAPARTIPESRSCCREEKQLQLVRGERRTRLRKVDARPTRSS